MTIGGALPPIPKFTKPWGLHGGLPGKNSYCGLVSRKGKESQLPSRVTTFAPGGKTIILQTPGAGGMGDPQKRAPKKVRRDVLDGLVSIQRAREIYGVVIDSESMEIDEEATAGLRGKVN